MSVNTNVTDISLQEWALAHEPNDELIFGSGYWEQIMFVRDKLITLFCPDYKKHQNFLENNVRVVSTHMSKSVLLPVYQIISPEGTVFTLRYNNYNWKISVKSPSKVTFDFMDLFDPNESINAIYCEGFPHNSVYGPYADNDGDFTIALYDDFAVWTFFYIYSRKVLGLRAQNT